MMNPVLYILRNDIRLAKKMFAMANSHRELQAVSRRLGIVVFRFIPANYISLDPIPYLNRLNEDIIHRIPASSSVFVSNTLVDKRYCLRARIVNFGSHAMDIETFIGTVVSTGRAIRSEWQEKELKRNYFDKPYY